MEKAKGGMYKTLVEEEEKEQGRQSGENSPERTHEAISLSEENRNWAEQDGEQRIPLLYLDVNLRNEGLARVVVFDGDDPREVATRFGRQHELSESKTEKLIRVITQQLRNVLSQIKEHDEEEDE